jgi:hypothetical protein
MARNKGKRGERAVIDWLQPLVDSICDELYIKRLILQRNTIQSDKGGTDIVGIDWMAAEVKNVENDTPGLLDSWWQQCVDQAEKWSVSGRPRLCPVLFYMRNRRPIRVRMFGIIFDKNSRDTAREVWCNAVIDIDRESFENYFIQRTKLELQKEVKPCT